MKKCQGQPGLPAEAVQGGELGYPVLEEQNRELLLAWLEGDRTVKLSQLHYAKMKREDT